MMTFASPVEACFECQLVHCRASVGPLTRRWLPQEQRGRAKWDQGLQPLAAAAYPLAAVQVCLFAYVC